jgi:hypothetical protein
MLFAKALNDLDWPIAFGLVCGRSLEKVAVASGTRLNAQALGSFTNSQGLSYSLSRGPLVRAVLHQRPVSILNGRFDASNRPPKPADMVL